MSNSIIFDLDGTLWNSVETCVTAWNQVLREKGHKRSISHKQLESVMGMKYDEIAKVLLQNLPKSEQDSLLDEISLTEVSMLRKVGGQLYEHTLAVLSELAGQYSLFIVSNCQEGYIEAFLDYYGIGDLITDFLSPGITGEGKSFNLQQIIAKNQLSRTVYVGDTDTDRKACLETGIPFIFVDYGFGQSPDAVNSISDISELTNTKILRKIMGS